MILVYILSFNLDNGADEKMKLLEVPNVFSCSWSKFKGRARV